MSPQPSKQPDARPIRAFLDPKTSRDEVLRTYPQLRGAYDVHDKLVDTLSQNKPLTADIRRDVAQLIRNTIARNLVDGREPQATAKLHEAVRVHVAIKNLHTVEDALQRDPRRPQPLPAENRQVLIRHAEVAMTIDPRPAVRRAGAYASPERFEAYDVAHGIARIDYPRARNPFADAELAKVYRSEQHFRQHELTRGRGRGDQRQPVIDHGLER